LASPGSPGHQAFAGRQLGKLSANVMAARRVVLKNDWQSDDSSAIWSVAAGRRRIGNDGVGAAVLGTDACSPHQLSASAVS
jgi:hypothetical protein